VEGKERRREGEEKGREGKGKGRGGGGEENPPLHAPLIIISGYAPDVGFYKNLAYDSCIAFDCSLSITLPNFVIKV